MTVSMQAVEGLLEPATVRSPDGETPVREAPERRGRQEASPRLSPALAGIVRRLVRTRRGGSPAVESINAVMAGVVRAVELAGVLEHQWSPASRGVDTIDAFMAQDNGSSPQSSGHAACGGAPGQTASAHPEDGRETEDKQ